MHKPTDAADTHSHGHCAAWPSAGCAGISHYGAPRIRAARGSEALAPRMPSATPSGAARCELKTASGTTYGRGAASQTAPSEARILNELRVPEAVRPGGHEWCVRLGPGHQSPRAWRYSFLEATTTEHRSHSLLMNVSARVSKKFNAVFSSRPVQWVMRGTQTMGGVSIRRGLHRPRSRLVSETPIQRGEGLATRQRSQGARGPCHTLW